MTLRTLERSIDMLLASDRPKVMLQFFGGEALIEWDLVWHGITYGREQAKHWGERGRVHHPAPTAGPSIKRSSTGFENIR